MTHAASASSAAARGLLAGLEKERQNHRHREKDDSDDHLLRPVTNDTTRARWGSESTGKDTLSREGSPQDLSERVGQIRTQEPKSMEELEGVRSRRKQGEEYVLFLRLGWAMC